MQEGPEKPASGDGSRPASSESETGSAAEASRAGLDEVTDREAERDAHSVPGAFSVREFVRRHPVALGAGAVFVAGTIYTTVKIRRSLPFRIYRAVRRLSLSELFPKR